VGRAEARSSKLEEKSEENIQIDAQSQKMGNVDKENMEYDEIAQHMCNLKKRGERERLRSNT
jgi:hypothetical protein